MYSKKLVFPKCFTLNNLNCLFQIPQALCKLTIDYSLLVHEPSVKEQSEAFLVSAQWGKKLGRHKVSFTEAFRGGMEEKKKVASNLFRNKDIELELIVDYCRYIRPKYSWYYLTCMVRLCSPASPQCVCVCVCVCVCEGCV